MGILARLGRVLARADAGSAYTTTGTGRRSQAWRPPAYGPNAALDYSLTGLRNQSRELVRKNALAGSAVERVVSNVVGTGIKPKLTEDGLAKLWKSWTDQSAADGQLDFYGQQQQVMRAVVESGECFVRLRNRLPVDGLVVPLQIEVLEPEFVPVQWNMTAASGGEIRQGIEFDPILRSKRVAYWIYQRHPNDGGTVPVEMLPVRVPASEILHVYWPGRPGQVRGEPWLSRVLDRLADIEAYDKAELVRKKTAAMFVAFVSGSLPDGLSLDDIAQIYGDGDPNDPASQTKIENGVGQATVEPGTILYGKPGENMTFAAPSDVGSQYEAFLRSHKRDVAAAIGLLYEQLTGDYGQVNDRTWRAAVTEFRRRCEGWQHHLVVFQFCRPVFGRWSDMALVSGAASARALKAATSPDWTPPAWPYINPLQDVQAREAEVRAGFTSRTAVVSERGEDAAQVDAEQAADNQRADGLGLAHDSDGRRSIKGAVAAEAPTKAGETGGPQPVDQPQDGSAQDGAQAN